MPVYSATPSTSSLFTPAKLPWKALLCITAVTIIGGLANGVIGPMLPDMQENFGGLSNGQAGLVFTSIYAGALVADAISLRLSAIKTAPAEMPGVVGLVFRMCGLRKFAAGQQYIGISVVILMVSLVLMAVCPTTVHGSHAAAYALFNAFDFLMGFAIDLMGIFSNVLISVWPEQILGMAYNFLHFGFGLGAVCGPWIYRGVTSLPLDPDSTYPYWQIAWAVMAGWTALSMLLVVLVDMRGPVVLVPDTNPESAEHSEHSDTDSIATNATTTPISTPTATSTAPRFTLPITSTTALNNYTSLQTVDESEENNNGNDGNGNNVSDGNGNGNGSDGNEFKEQQQQPPSQHQHPHLHFQLPPEQDTEQDNDDNAATTPNTPVTYDAIPLLMESPPPSPFLRSIPRSRSRRRHSSQRKSLSARRANLMFTPHPHRSHFSNLMHTGTFWLLAVAIFLYNGAELSMGGWLYSVVDSMGYAVYGDITTSLFWAGILTGRLVSSALSPRIATSAAGILVLIRASALLATVSALCVCLLPSLSLVCICAFFAGVGFAAIYPMIIALSSLIYVDPVLQTTTLAIGALVFFGSIGPLVFPAFIGFIGDASGNIRIALLIAPICQFCVLVLMQWFALTMNHRNAQAARAVPLHIVVDGHGSSAHINGGAVGAGGAGAGAGAGVTAVGVTAVGVTAVGVGGNKEDEYNVNESGGAYNVDESDNMIGDNNRGFASDMESVEMSHLTPQPN